MVEMGDTGKTVDMILQETYMLSGGVKIPKLGLGTWLIPDE